MAKKIALASDEAHPEMFKAGYKAASEGKSRAPAQDPAFMAAVDAQKGKPLGSSIPLSKAWIKGFQKHSDEQAEKTLSTTSAIDLILAADKADWDDKDTIKAEGKPGSVVQVSRKDGKKGVDNTGYIVIIPDADGFQSGFYYYPSNAEGELQTERKRGIINHSNMFWKGDSLKLTGVQAPIEEKSYHDFKWYETPYDNVNTELANGGTQYALFQKYAPEHIKDIYAEQESQNFHTENGEMVKDFAEFVVSGGIPANFSVDMPANQMPVADAATTAIDQIMAAPEGESSEPDYNAISDYLEQWRNPDEYSDFNLAMDRGLVLYAAWLIDSAGAIDPANSNDPAMEEAIVKMLGEAGKEAIDEERNEVLKNVEVWTEPKTNVSHFIPYGDVNYFLDQKDLKEMGLQFEHGYDKDGTEYKQSILSSLTTSAIQMLLAEEGAPVAAPADPSKPFTVAKTYNVVTQESAQRGDFAEDGFVFEDTPMSLIETLQEVENLGSFENLQEFRPGAGQALYQTDPETDIHTGDETQEALHIEGDDASMQQLTEILKSGNIREKIRELFDSSEAAMHSDPSITASAIEILLADASGEGADKHQLKILKDTVRNPDKSLLGGPTAEEAKKILKEKFKYTDDQIKKLESDKTSTSATDLDKIGLNDYLIAALWSSTGDDGEPLDDKYSVDDIDPESLAMAQKDWLAFQQEAGDLLNGLDLAQVAHDFWLTRNRHGAGFWDRDYDNGEVIGEELTELSHKFGEVDIYVGDDGKLHFSRSYEAKSAVKAGEDSGKLDVTFRSGIRKVTFENVTLEEAKKKLAEVEPDAWTDTTWNWKTETRKASGATVAANADKKGELDRALEVLKGLEVKLHKLQNTWPVGMGVVDDRVDEQRKKLAEDIEKLKPKVAQLRADLKGASSAISELMGTEASGPKQTLEDIGQDEEDLILDLLHNDEASTDEDLEQRFVQEMGIAPELAKQIVARRQEFLLDMTGQKRLKAPLEGQVAESAGKKWKVQDWAGNEMTKFGKFNSFEDGWAYIQEHCPEEDHQEYSVVEDKGSRERRYLDPKDPRGAVSAIQQMLTASYLEIDDIPKDWEVQPLQPGQPAEDKVTCHDCGLSWDDAIPTSMTPTPSARCPFESFHQQDEEEGGGPTDDPQALATSLKSNIAILQDIQTRVSPDVLGEIEQVVESLKYLLEKEGVQSSAIQVLLAATDEEARQAEDLILFADTTSELYPQKQAVQKQLLQKRDLDAYDPNEALALWKQWVEAAVAQYIKEFGDSPFSEEAMNLAAQELMKRAEAELDFGEHNHLLTENSAQSSIEMLLASDEAPALEPEADAAYGNDPFEQIKPGKSFETPKYGKIKYKGIDIEDGTKPVAILENQNGLEIKIPYMELPQFLGIDSNYLKTREMISKISAGQFPTLVELMKA